MNLYEMHWRGPFVQTAIREWSEQSGVVLLEVPHKTGIIFKFTTVEDEVRHGRALTEAIADAFEP